MAAVLVVLVVLIVAGGGLAWMNYTQSPTYSLGMLARSAQNRDWGGVQKYVDVDAVAGNAVDAAVGASLGQGASGFGALGAEITPSLKPALVQQAKDALKKAIEQGGAGTGGIQGALVSALVAKQVRSVTYTRDEALVTVEVPKTDGSTFELKLRMKRVDDYWRVVAIDNVLDLPALLSN